MVVRVSLSVVLGVIVTLALFYLMQALIQGADSALTDDKIGNLVDFVRVKQDPDLETKNRKPATATVKQNTAKLANLKSIQRKPAKFDRFGNVV